MTAAGLPPSVHPYMNMAHFFNSLPPDSPLRQLAMDKDYEGGLFLKGEPTTSKLSNGHHGHSSRSPSPSPRSPWNPEEDKKVGRFSPRYEEEEDMMMEEEMEADEEGIPNGVDRKPVIKQEVEDEPSVDNKVVQRMLDTVNANVTRKLLEACQLRSGNLAATTTGPNFDEQHSSRSSPINARTEDDEEDDEDVPNNNNNNNSIVKLEHLAVDSERKRKKEGIEGLAARLELCQQQNKNDIEKNQQQRKQGSSSLNGGDEIPDHSSQSENESSEHRK